jgi:hypothetical protein
MNPAKSESSKVSVSMTSERLGEIYQTEDASFFPLFDRYTRFCRLPKFIYELAFYFIIFQQFVVGFWIYWSPELFSSDAISDKIIVKFAEIAFLAPLFGMEDASFPTMIVYNSVFLVSILFLLMTILNFKSSRNLNSVILYCSRFLCEIVTMIMFNPIAQQAGFCIYRIGKGHISAFEIISLLLYALNYVYNILIFFFIFGILNSGAYIQQHSFVTFEYEIFALFIVGNSLFNFLVIVLQLYPDWVDLVMLVIHIILLSFQAISFCSNKSINSYFWKCNEFNPL